MQITGVLASHYVLYKCQNFAIKYIFPTQVENVAIPAVCSISKLDEPL